MSDQEKFIERWSRLKQKAVIPAKDSAVEQPERQEEKPSGDPADRLNSSTATGKEKEPAAFDPESLPSIDSILADTDIRPFLAAGVPEELKHAALQRAWQADPAIRDFVELLENSWDFNDPNGIHGFGPLEMSDELKQMVDRMFDPPPSESDQLDQNDEEEGQTKAEEPENPVTNPESEKASAQIAVNSPVTDRMRVVSVTAQQDFDDEKSNDRTPKRTHGSALPK